MPHFKLPVVDEPVAALGSPSVLPSDSEGFPKDQVDKRIKTSVRRAFEPVTRALKVSVASSLAARAMVLWCQCYVEQNEFSSTILADIREIAATTAFIANTSADLMQLSARARASTFAVCGCVTRIGLQTQHTPS